MTLTKIPAKKKVDTLPVGTRRNRLSRDRILAAALRILDSADVNALTMRRLGAELGVGTMSLYKHVKNKTELLSALVVMSLSGVKHDSGGNWRECLQGSMRSYLAAFRQHPHLLELRARYYPAPEMYAHHEQDLRTLIGAGFAPKDALMGLQALFAFTIGSASQQLTAGRHREEVASQRESIWSNLPLIAAGYAELEARGSEGPFEVGLSLLLDGLERRYLDGS